MMLTTIEIGDLFSDKTILLHKFSFVNVTVCQFKRHNKPSQPIYRRLVCGPLLRAISKPVFWSRESAFRFQQ